MNRKRRLLVIDDEPAMAEWLHLLLERAGYDVRTTLRGEDGEALFSSWAPEAVVTDLMLPDVDGIELVKRFKQADPGVEVIVLTGMGNVQSSVAAVKAGALDFLEKPVDPALLLLKMEQALRQRRYVDENEQLRKQLNRGGSQGIVYRSKKMEELFDLVEAVAPSEANILIQGENGTGKELVANAIHERSQRAKGPFIKINCAAIPHELLESELFGHKKGTFTGAIADKEGLLKMADRGSLLLDEIGEMPAALQAKLLRVLQDRAFRPLGGDRVIPLDFRLICATNIDIQAALKSGQLREDLYFRINTLTLRVPPLRERTEDIPLLCDHFIEAFCRRYQQRELKRLTPGAYQVLMRNRWSGNVRELENALERAVLVAKGREIAEWDLPESVRCRPQPPSADWTAPAFATLAEIERAAIRQTLQRTNWNKQEAARILGLYRTTLYSKMRKHEITSAEPQASVA